MINTRAPDGANNIQFKIILKNSIQNLIEYCNFFAEFNSTKYAFNVEIGEPPRTSLAWAKMLVIINLHLQEQWQPQSISPP